MSTARKNDSVTIDVNKMQLTMTQKEAEEFKQNLNASSISANNSRPLYPQLSNPNPSAVSVAKPKTNPTASDYNRYIQHAAEIRANILSLNDKLQNDRFLRNQIILQEKGKLVLGGAVAPDDSSATTEYKELLEQYEALWNKYVALQTNAAAELNIDISEIEQIKAVSHNKLYPTFQQMYEQERQEQIDVINTEVNKLKEDKKEIELNFKVRTGTSYQKMYEKLYDLTSWIAPIPITVPLAIGTVIVHGIDFLISKIRQAAKSVSISSAEKKAAKEIRSAEEALQTVYVKKVYAREDTQFKQTFFQLAQVVNSCKDVKLSVPPEFSPSHRKP